MYIQSLSLQINMLFQGLLSQTDHSNVANSTIVEFANTVDPDERAHNELSH